MSLLDLTPIEEGDTKKFFVRILLHGDSGSGKTTAASTMPGVCFLLLEPNGLLSVRARNPKAIVIDVVNTAREKDVPPMTVVREFFKAAMDGSLAKAGVHTVAVDSMTELQRLLRDEITGSKRAGPSGEVKWTLEDWSTLTDRMRKLMRVIRDLPFHVVAICLSDVEQDDSGSRYVVPMFQGKKLPNEVAGYFNVVGYVFRRSEEQEQGPNKVMHRVLLRGSSNYLTKTLPQLNSIESPDLADWLARIESGERAEQSEEPVDPNGSKPRRRRARG